MRQEILARPGGSVTEGCRDGLVNDVAFTKSLVCVYVCISTQSVLYGTVTLCPLCGEIGGTCRQVRESFSVQIGLLEPVCCTRPAVLTRKQCS
jgi:hypothetical protein